MTVIRPSYAAREARWLKAASSFAISAPGTSIVLVIASAAQQSRIFPRRQTGLLRSARNDGVFGWQGRASIRIPDRRHTFASSRRVRPSFASSPHPQLKEGAGKTGCRLAPAVHCAVIANKNLHSGIQVKPNIRPSLRNGWNGLCRALPGERCTIAPVALRMADARGPVGLHTSPQDL